MIQSIVKILQSRAGLRLAVLFGSAARDEMRPASDVDIAVMYDPALHASETLQLIQKIGVAVGRPVDLVDITTANPALLSEIFHTGTRIFGTEHEFATAACRSLVDVADFSPLVLRAQAERRQRWLQP